MNKMFLKKILRVFRLLLIAIAVILAFWLFLKDFVGSGVIVFKNDFSSKGKDPQILDLYPDVRVREPEQDEEARPDGSRQGDWYQNMYVDPVYFKVNAPREFYKAKLKVKYRTNRQPFLQVGVKAGPGELDFEFWPIEFKKLDELDWSRVERDNLVLWQKVKQYDSIDDFLDNLPKKGRIALYNLDLQVPNREDYNIMILNTKTNLDYVDYIFTDYVTPEAVDDWKVGEAEFEISRENFELGKLIFIISAPELDINKGDVDISEIEVFLERPPFELGNLFGDFGEYLRSVVDK